MTRAGDRLRAMAARVCSAQTMERLIDPLVADMQTEYAEAIRHGRVWRSRRVRMAGYAAFLKVIALCACEESMRVLHGWTADDRQALARTIGFSISGIVVVTLLLLIPPLLTPRLWTRMEPASQVRLLVYLVPQALPLAVPVGLLLGILYGLAGRDVSRRSQGAVLVMALGCSVASFATVAWILPLGNQAFRQSFVGREAISKGLNEMTVSVLRQEIDSYTETPMAGSSLVRGLRFSYYQRWALSCVTLVFALIALSLVPRHRVGRLIPCVAACGVTLAYYAVLWKARNLGMSGALSPFIAAWLPNAVFVLGSAALMAVASRRSDVAI